MFCGERPPEVCCEKKGRCSLKSRRCGWMVLGWFLVGVLFLSPQGGGGASAAEKIRLGILPIVDSLPYILIEEKGLDRKHGFELETFPFASALERDAALTSGSADGALSDTVTSIRYPDGVKDGDFRGMLKEDFGVVVAGAQADWKGHVFRIGHMAGTTWTELAAGWAAIEAAMPRCGHALPKGTAVAAMMDFSA